MKTYLFILLFSIIYGSPISAENPKFTTCSKTIQCGTITSITYPFYDGKTRPGYCGHPGFKLNCNVTTTPQITISNQDYNLLGINKSTNTITISMNNFNFTNACPNSLNNFTFDFSTSNFSSADQNLNFFYDCAVAFPDLLLRTQCDLLGSGSTGYYLTRSMLETNKGLDLLGNCKSMILIPILQSEAELIDKSPSLVALVKALKSGFELGLIAGLTGSCSSCVGSGGVCGSDSGKFVCYCADGDFDSKCEVDQVKDEEGYRTAKLILFSVLSGSTAIILLGLLVYFKRGKIRGTHNFQITRDNKNVENVLKSYASLTPKRYTYSNIKKMTSSFGEKLGEGGFGEVYKGKLNDGRLVAVKLLKSSKGNGEGFINEVASMGRTSHVNVITLLGFCLEGNKRALVYEYMANGSLQKFMHTEANINGNSSLPLDTLFQIVIGIARGLEYLHRGCVTRILHFDIKPHNILLDEEFFPKISDFGLAKVTPQDKQSRVSMSGTRGTIGYIAPEVFCRSFGDVSHKSDVYSYGMMVLEVIGSRKRANRDQVENSSELYFPQWLYKELEHEEEVEIDITMDDSDKELKRKMIVVSLWCIQPLPSNRPSMSKVVQMLEGSLDSIEIPPMPLLSSPPRPRWDSSISSTMTT